MEPETNHNAQQAPSWRLPRRDYVILPLLCLATMLVMFGIAEGASRLIFVQHERDACMVHDSVLGTRFRPNCVSRVKAAEGPWVINRYNACGYRTPESCGPKPAGDVRIAVLGSSIAQGYLVPYQETFAARAAEQLTHRCGEPVQFQNLASIGYVWERLARRADEALTLHPNAAIIVLIPFDLQQTDPGDDDGPGPKVAHEGPMKRLELLLKNSRALVAAQHYLFSRPDLYTQFYLRYGDRADLLRVPLTPAWQRRVDDFDTLLGGIAERISCRARAAAVDLRAAAGAGDAACRPSGACRSRALRLRPPDRRGRGSAWCRSLDLEYRCSAGYHRRPACITRSMAISRARGTQCRPHRLPRPCSDRCRRSPPARRPISWSVINRHERSVGRISRFQRHRRDAAECRPRGVVAPGGDVGGELRVPGKLLIKSLRLAAVRRLHGVWLRRRFADAKRVRVPHGGCFPCCVS